MKKIIMLLYILAVTTQAGFCPNREKELIIVASEPIKPYQRLIYAVGMVESSLDTLAYNPVEKATGYFQVRPIRLKDFNDRTGKKYKLGDMYDYYKAEEVFLYYATLDLEKTAKAWNGSGYKTEKYWQKVKKYLQ
ncbi:MAG: hypothetical protein GYA14_15930 [Ignavibacteria bacterium]|nr:hypothetical protein [Ignavibacteria bacterium]